jgi:hypothetical protein
MNPQATKREETIFRTMLIVAMILGFAPSLSP